MGLAAGPRTAIKRHAAVCAGDGTRGETVRMAGRNNIATTMGLGEGKQESADVVEVPCRSLTTLMAEAKLEHGVSFLSLDVEQLVSTSAMGCLLTAERAVASVKCAACKFSWVWSAGPESHKPRETSGSLHALNRLK